MESNNTWRILIVDDDAEVRRVVTRSLIKAGFQVSSLGLGREVVDTVKRQGIDLVLMDLGLPDADGLSLTRTLCENSQVGIIILSGRSDTVGKTIGLEMGADDYLAKPFAPRELVARVRSVLRRLEAKSVDPLESPAVIYAFEGWTVDTSRRRVIASSGEIMDLPSSEYRLLLAFVEHPNRILSRSMIINLTHGNHTPAFERSVDVSIGRLRSKIEKDPQNPEIIKTSRGEGYMFTLKVTRS